MDAVGARAWKLALYWLSTNFNCIEQPKNVENENSRQTTGEWGENGESEGKSRGQGFLVVAHVDDRAP
jgi:hypothetical protein